MNDRVDLQPDLDAPHAKPRGGRPTRAAAAERDERVLEIASRLFLERGYDATSMEAIADAAAIGKATLYARYADKGALFADVLRRRILQVYGPLEEEFKGLLEGSADMERTLCRVASRLIEMSTSAETITLGRILTTQAPRFPDLARLAISEGTGRQQRLVESVLARLARDRPFLSDDLPLMADLFVSIVLGRVGRLKMYGIPIDPDTIEHRTTEAVRVFVRGVTAAR
jgi:AcrR family transcriptional regulator